MNKNYCVITTINPPTKAIEVLYEKFGENLIIVGDKKTPSDWNYKGIKPIEFEPKPYAPDNHYARKNAGYMEAFRRGAYCLFSCDDDTIPNEKWVKRGNIARPHYIAEDDFWCNIYGAMGVVDIWPRGLPLNEIKRYRVTSYRRERQSPIQQELVNGDPDVDSIWRLTQFRNISFNERRSIFLDEHVWCPINSQCTWFFKKAFPLMYLPVTANFRLTDIWGGFVAQRCIWEFRNGVTFHSPATTHQVRNKHDLMADFKDEIPGYLHNSKIANELSCLILSPNEDHICDNMLRCYSALVDMGLFDISEIHSLKSWIKDYEETKGTMG